MGTTLTAKNAGSISSVFTVLIEGYEYALTNAATTAAAVTALAVTDWTQAIGGLYVDIDNEQSIDPYKPLGGGGKCILRVASTSASADRFGIDTHRKRSGFETQLAETIHRGTGTIKALSTAAFPSSGYIHIGTECISYTGKTSASGITPATFTGCSRGRFSPFKTARDPETNFAHEHRVVLDPQSVLLQPIISTTQRIWPGRYVAVYEHRVVDGVLDVLAEAHLAFAGRIVDISDDGNSTAVELEHVLDVVENTTIGRQLWSGVVKEGIYIKRGHTFTMRDYTNGSSGGLSATPLNVIANTLLAVAPYQIPEGYYTADDIHQRLNAWWSAAYVDGDLNGTYSMYVDETNDGPRTIVQWSISSVNSVSFLLVIPNQVAQFLGWTVPTSATHTWIEPASAPGGSTLYETSDSIPLRSLVDKSGNVADDGLNFEITDERGSFINQIDALPDSFHVTDTTREWGLFLFDEKVTIIASVTRDSEGRVLELTRGRLSLVNIGPAYNDDIRLYTVPWDDSSPDIKVRQILAIEAPAAAFLKLCFYSTGTVGHNHETFDGVELGLGLAVPGSLLGADFESSCDDLPGAGESVVSIIDKTTTFRDLLDGDLILRRAFLIWKDGGFRFGSWRTPTVDAATVTLNTSNKCTPAGNEDDHRTSSRESTEWQRPIARILFDRDITNLSVNEGYRSEVTLEDSTAVDDAGGAGALVTVKVRNAFGTESGIGANIKALIANFLATMPMFTRPGVRLTRTLLPSLVEQVPLGSIVLVTDDHVRDPATGIRGIEDHPAIVVRRSDSAGGLQIDGSVSDPIATVELFIASPQARDEAGYAPTADVDDTYDTGDYDAGYDAVTKTLRCYGYRYGDDGSVVAPLLTDAEYFPIGAKVRITERDPVDETAPQTWDDTVAAQSADDITLTTGLSGWDNTKFYRISTDTYGDATSTQHLKSYQADDADGLIENTAQPYIYSGQAAASVFAANMNSTIGIEVPPDQYAIDGAGRDVGTEQALARLLDNFTDHKSALSLPSLSSTVMTNADYMAGYKLLAMAPIHLTTEVLSSNVWRELALAPWFRSADGTPVTLRGTLCRSQPSGTTVQDIDRGAVLSEVSWSTSNTNWEAGNASEVDCRRKETFTGQAWLLVEGTYQCETRGLAQVAESERLYDNEWWVP